MAIDKNVNVNINTSSSGEGVKKTTENIDKLNKGSKAAKDTAAKLRKEIDGLEDVSRKTKKELEKTAFKLDDVAYKASKAAAAAEKLAKKEAAVAQEAKELAKHLNKSGIAAEDYGREMTKAELATRRLISQQKAANAAAKKTPGTMDKAGKSKRNLGRAALEASRGIADMQYGIRGVLNNIPGLILMLGGSAGLTAVISILAVGFTVLSDQLGKTTEDTEKLTDAILDETEALQSARLETQQKADADAKAAVIMEELTEQIQAQKVALEDEKTAIDRQTSSLVKQLKIQEDLSKAKFNAARSVVRTDEATGKITGAESARQLAALNAAEKGAKAELKSAEAEVKIAGLKSKRLKNEDRLAEISDIELGSERFAEKRKQNAEALLDKAAEILTALPGSKDVEGDIRDDPRRFVQESDQALFESKSPIGRGALDAIDPTGATDRAGKDILDQLAIGEARELLKQYEAINKDAAKILATSKELQAEANAKRGSLKGEQINLGSQNKALTGSIFSAEEDLDLAKQREELQRKADDLSAKEKELTQTLADSGKKFDSGLDAITTGADEAKELAGKTKEQLEASDANVKAAVAALREITQNKVVEDKELGAFNQAIRTLQQSVSGSNQATLATIRILQADATTQRQAMNSITQQLRTLQSQNLSR